MEYQPRTLQVGEQFYTERHNSWGGNAEYCLCKVHKITPTGRIVVTWGGNAGTDTFDKRGRKLGDHYGTHIDWMPVAERSQFIRYRNKLHSAAQHINNIINMTPLRTHNADAIDAMIKQIQEQLAKATEWLVAAVVDRPTPADNQSAGG